MAQQNLVLYLISQDAKLEKAKAKAQFQDMVFCASVASNMPTLYQELYGPGVENDPTIEIDESEVEYVAPTDEMDLEQFKRSMAALGLDVEV